MALFFHFSHSYIIFYYLISLLSFKASIETRFRPYATKNVYPKKMPSDVLSSSEESLNRLTPTKKLNIFQNCNSMLRRISATEVL